MPGGTPFSPDLFVRICSEIALGRSLRSVCREEWAPHISNVMEWLATKPELGEQYARAKDESADSMADEILDIADDCAGVVTSEQVQAAKLRVDARKWVASKLKPKKYGDRVHNELSGTVSLEQIVTGDSRPRDDRA